MTAFLGNLVAASVDKRSGHFQAVDGLLNSGCYRQMLLHSALLFIYQTPQPTAKLPNKNVCRFATVRLIALNARELNILGELNSHPRIIVGECMRLTTV